MCIADSLDIFQSKMSELMESLEYVQAYSDDVFCISRSSLEDHPEKLEEVSQAPLQRWLESQRWKINILHTWNRIPRVHTDQRWH